MGAQCGWAAQEVSRFGPQNLEWRPVRPDGQEGFLVWASKPGVAPGAAVRPGGFGSLGLKTTKAAGFSVWASKPRMEPDAVGRPWWFRWFGLKTIIDEGFPVLTQNRGRGLA